MIVPKKISLLLHALLISSLLLGSALTTTYAQSPDDETMLSGWFTIVWGDSADGKSSTIYTLTSETGEQTVLLLTEEVARSMGGVLAFNGKYVDVKGTRAPLSATILESLPPGLLDSTGSGPSQAPPEALQPISISLAQAPQSFLSAAPGPSSLAVSGSHPWVSIMCKFSDKSEEPNDAAYFQGMYDHPTVGLNVYWKELSYNTVNINGSGVGGTGWYDLPHDLYHYNPGHQSQGTDLYLLADECIEAADAYVDFSQYAGINMMFNFDFDNGWAWGGSRYMTLDGVRKSWRITWEPPWSYQNITVISHEMGHGFGLPHSTAPGGGVYDNPWDVMSNTWDNCGAANDPTYGCMAQHTIANYKDRLEWIPAARKITVAPGGMSTFVLEDLAAPATANYQLAMIPIGGSTTNFYTVEARKLTGFDTKLRGEGIIIHRVNTTESIPAVLEPDGAITDAWTPGETFIDETNDISVQVNTAAGSGFQVTVSNGPPSPQYTLSVYTSGTGAGNVSSNPAGINCGSDCTEDYDENTSVTLSPSAAAGSTFTGWSGSCSGTGTCQVVMSAARSVTATFTLDTPPRQYTLSVATSGTGSGTVSSDPAGISCGADCTEDYDEDTTITLTPGAAAGSTFTGWSGDCSGTGTCRITMDAARSVSATFTLDTPPQQYPLSVSKSGTGSGTVSSNPAGINCGGDCSEDYDEDTEVTLTATASAGSDFAGWSGDCSGTGACQVTMEAAWSVTATFTLEPPPQYTLSVDKSGTGSGTVSSNPAGISCGADCGEDYNENTVVTLTATASAGSYFAGWSGDCSGNGACQVTMDAPRSATAAFAVDTYLERFVSYKIRTTTKTPKFEKFTTSLGDQFEGKDFDVKKMESLLNPAAGTIDEIEDMDSHLIGYQIKKIRGEAKHEKQRGVLVTNELGTLIVDTKKSDSLFVPSAKDLDSPVEPLDPVNIDHFKCYSVTVKKKICEDDPTLKCKTDEDCGTGSCNLGFPKGIQREYVDQFDQAKLFDIKKPTKLCTPVDLDDGGIMDEEVNLMCYQAKNAKGEPRHIKVQGIYVNNQFSASQLEPEENWQVDTVKEEEICIPSFIGPIE